MAKTVIERKKIYFSENGSSAVKKDNKLNVIIGSGIISLLLILVIVYTLPLTVLTFSGLLVYTSIVALAIFLLVLLARYFGILVLSYMHLAKYTNEIKSDYFPFISIIVPVYNEGIVLRDSIASLLKLNYPNYEIIIVNDGSTDDTAQVGESLAGFHRGISSNVKVSLINRPNGGKAKALNSGILYSSAEFVLCMDGDSQLSPDTLSKSARHFRNPQIGAVAGNVKVLNRKKFLTDMQALEYIEGLNMPRSAQSFLKLVNIIPGPIGLFRRKAIIDAGGYSSDTFAEDADMTLKILANGWKINYEPMAISYTEAPETLQQLLKQRYRWTRGILQSIRKHKKFLINPTLNVRNTFVLWMMFYEAMIWPAMNIFANLFFIIIALMYGMSNLIFFWWAGIAILDIISALYCVAAEKEEFRLAIYAFMYRLVFILIIDITKAMATIEEFLGIQMTWGKLDRMGNGLLKT